MDDNMRRRPIHILSIDDDISCQRAIAKFLTLAGGHKVEVAYDGEDGIKKALEIKPDVILLDLVMPGINGGEVLDALYHNPATMQIPVFMITGTDLQEAERSSLYRNGNLKSIHQKPADYSEILQKISLFSKAPDEVASNLPSNLKTIFPSCFSSYTCKPIYFLHFPSVYPFSQHNSTPSSRNETD